MNRQILSAAGSLAALACASLARQAIAQTGASVPAPAERSKRSRSGARRHRRDSPKSGGKSSGYSSRQNRLFRRGAHPAECASLPEVATL